MNRAYVCGVLVVAALAACERRRQPPPTEEPEPQEVTESARGEERAAARRSGPSVGMRNGIGGPSTRTRASTPSATTAQPPVAERRDVPMPELPPPAEQEPETAAPAESALPPGTVIPPEERGPIAGADLFADPDAMVPGTNVALDDVRVVGKYGNLMRVAYGRHTLFVAPVDPSLLEHVRVGTRVNVQGTLRESPRARQAAVSFAISSRDAARLERDGIYVDAWSVTDFE